MIEARELTATKQGRRLWIPVAEVERVEAAETAAGVAGAERELQDAQARAGKLVARLSELSGASEAHSVAAALRARVEAQNEVCGALGEPLEPLPELPPVPPTAAIEAELDRLLGPRNPDVLAHRRASGLRSDEFELNPRQADHVMRRGERRHADGLIAELEAKVLRVRFESANEAALKADARARDALMQLEPIMREAWTARLRASAAARENHWFSEGPFTSTVDVVCRYMFVRPNEQPSAPLTHDAVVATFAAEEARVMEPTPAESARVELEQRTAEIAAQRAERAEVRVNDTRASAGEL